jgi:DNA-binding transcriptional LysR family regulator
MELRQLSQFVAVAELLSFRRAAERLHMAQPPLSVAIRKLEDELGAELFERRGRSIRLTAAGDEALRIARRVLAEADELRQATRKAERGESGRVRVGFVGSATYALLPRLLPAFRARYPDIELVLQESNNLGLISQVENETLDLGLVRFPTGHASLLQYALIERDRFQAVLPLGHPLTAQATVTLKALAACPLIDYASTRVPGLHAMVMLAFQHAGLSPRVAQEATQVQTVISLVESGLGVALVPSVSARLASRSVVFRPIHGLPASADIGIALAWKPAAESAAARRFREVAMELPGQKKRPRIAARP